MKLLSTLTIILLSLISCGQTEKDKNSMHTSGHKFTNSLIHETSPYLLQHAHNPVNWYPWGDEALKKARDENKLIIISIGYAACHWCHVMEIESFEDEEVATYMNEHFIAIKVDREERPDVDQIYMDAVQRMTGRGGWPLNCIALPDGSPVFGGTYFPRTDWLDVLQRVWNYYAVSPEETERQGERLSRALDHREFHEPDGSLYKYRQDDLDRIWSAWQAQLDPVQGGFRGAPKFPLPVGIEFLLDYQHLTGNEEVRDAITLQLDRMAAGGIYDQIGGGFARYATDAGWQVPHFEKMLYDNAQLIGVYSKAFRMNHSPRYQQVVSETIAFLKRELQDSTGAFQASLDADSEGKEGRYYVWRDDELDALPEKTAAWVKDYFSITAAGNWEPNRNILHRQQDDQEFAQQHGLTLTQLKQTLEQAKKALLELREQRPRPALDHKILIAWNALLIDGLVQAWRAFKDDHYLQLAEQTAESILQQSLADDGRLNHNLVSSGTPVNGFLDDYALMIRACIELYQVTFTEDWLMKAERMSRHLLEHFKDPVSRLFYYTSDLDAALITRRLDVTDNVISSGNSQMARNLYQLGHLLERDAWIGQARHMLDQVRDRVYRGSAYFAGWDVMMSWLVHPPAQISIIGDSSVQVLRQLLDHDLPPGTLLSGGADTPVFSSLATIRVEGKTLIHICRDRTCQLPVEHVDDALKILKDTAQ